MLIMLAFGTVAFGRMLNRTGAISGAACQGPCGAHVPNPIDLAGNRASGPWFRVGSSTDYDDTDVTPPSDPAVLSSTSTFDDGGGAGGGCNTAAEVSGENADGDNFSARPTRRSSSRSSARRPARSSERPAW